MSAPNPAQTGLTFEQIRAVSPALERYTLDTIVGNLWKRPELSPRDRSIVTVSALIARNQTIGMPHYFNVALESGVKSGELSEIITHLAFYAGWSNGFFAIAILKDIFAQRGIGADQLPPVLPELLPINQQAEDQRAAAVHSSTGGLFPGLEKFTTELLFKNLWLRPGLAPRDRSLATVSALIANGQSAQITFHLNKAMDNSLTRTQASEIVAQLAFYAGWPNAFSAVPVVKAVFESRGEK